MTWILAALVLFSSLVLIEQLVEEHEDRVARRPWHGRLEDQDTVVIGDSL